MAQQVISVFFQIKGDPVKDIVHSGCQRIGVRQNIYDNVMKRLSEQPATLDAEREYNHAQQHQQRVNLNQLQPIEWIQIPDLNYHYQHMMEIRHLHHRLHRHQQPRQLPQRAMQADYALWVFPDSVVEPDQANQHKERDPEELRPKVMNYPL